jgi:hypothetical protein
MLFTLALSVIHYIAIASTLITVTLMTLVINNFFITYLVHMFGLWIWLLNEVL